MDEAERYNTGAIILHWLIAALVLGNIALGLTFANTAAAQNGISPIAQFHKSIGLTILVLSVLRLVWRLTHKVPPVTGSFAALARAVHAIFYVLLIATPLAGWAVVSISPRNIPTSYFHLFTWPHIGFLHGMDLAARRQDISTAVAIHNSLAFCALALIGLHVVAALYHQLRGRGVIHRMLP
jgi:cytochrome b561